MCIFFYVKREPDQYLKCVDEEIGMRVFFSAVCQSHLLWLLRLQFNLSRLRRTSG